MKRMRKKQNNEKKASSSFPGKLYNRNQSSRGEYGSALVVIGHQKLSETDRYTIDNGSSKITVYNIECWKNKFQRKKNV